MAFERIAEQKIQDAMRAGAFDDLPTGERLDLDGYFSLPPHLRMAYSVLKSANCLPAEVELLNDVRRLEARYREAPVGAARDAIQSALTEAQLALSLALERLTRDARRG